MTFVTDGASASSYTLPFGTFTDTEVLIGFQTCRGTAVIYQYYLNNLALYMTKTIPEATSTLAQSHQMRLIAWNFKGYFCKFYLVFFYSLFPAKKWGMVISNSSVEPTRRVWQYHYYNGLFIGMATLCPGGIFGCGHSRSRHKKRLPPTL